MTKIYGWLLSAAFVTLVLVLFTPSALADGGDFPGQGDRHQWSEALPYYNLGNSLLNQERYQEAVEKYEAAVALYEFDPDFYVNLGVAYRKIGDLANAERAYKSATRLNPKDWVGWNDLANVYLKQDKLKETIETFQRTLKCDPPAADKAKIIQDIADITKVMHMQEPPNLGEEKAKPKPGNNGGATARKVGKSAPTKVKPPAASKSDMSKSEVGKSGVTNSGAGEVSASQPDPGNKTDTLSKAKTKTSPSAHLNTTTAHPPAPAAKETLKQSGWDYLGK